MSLTNEFMIQLIKHDKTYNLKKKKIQVKQKKYLFWNIVFWFRYMSVWCVSPVWDFCFASKQVSLFSQNSGNIRPKSKI